MAHDLYASVFRREQASEASEIRVSRYATIVLGLLAVGLGIAFQNQNVAYMVSLAFSIATSSTLPLLILVLYWPGLTTRGAVTGGCVGLASALLFRKVRIALAEKDIPFELQTEVPWHGTTATPQYNPLEKLPVLILDDGSAVYESHYIMEWLEAKYPAPALVPADIDGRLLARKFDVLRADARAGPPEPGMDRPAAPQGRWRRARDRPVDRRARARGRRNVRPRRHRGLHRDDLSDRALAGLCLARHLSRAGRLLRSPGDQGVLSRHAPDAAENHREGGLNRQTFKV